MGKNNNEVDPTIVSFLCDWCSRINVSAAGTDNDALLNRNQIVGVTCTGRIDPLFLIKAALHGADGILVMGCQPGQCHFKTGNHQAQRRFMLLKTIFETLGLDPDRMQIEWIKEPRVGLINKASAVFEQQIKEKGPYPLKNEIFI